MTPTPASPRCVALIPARGGSKRIPDKNIRPFCGVPVIGRSIRAALDSGLFDSVVVSTDSERIAEVARAHGAEVPFLRDDALAGDKAGLHGGGVTCRALATRRRSALLRSGVPNPL
jgi:CMP-N-acetylneuraminic acid synthetase